MKMMQRECFLAAADRLRNLLLPSSSAAPITLRDDLPFNSPNRVDLVDEDDAGRVLLGSSKQVAHAPRTHAYKHLQIPIPGVEGRRV